MRWIISAGDRQIADALRCLGVDGRSFEDRPGTECEYSKMSYRARMGRIVQDLIKAGL